MRSLFTRAASRPEAAALSAAKALEAEGRALDAIDVLTEASQQLVGAGG
jgi:hypothetical protein